MTQTDNTVQPDTFMEQMKINSMMQIARPGVSVLGVGGAGSNIVSWIKQKGIVGGKLIAANTDAPHLSITQADKRILLGEKLTHGRGCGGYPEKGMQAAEESLEEVMREVSGSSITFICAGLGGGTGTGAIRTFAKALRTSSNLVIGVVTLPFSVEKYRYEIAREALKSLQNLCDTVVTIDNTKLNKVAGNMPLQQALGVANELIGQFIKGITETITTASLINIDYADLRAIMERRGLAAIGVGEQSGANRVEAAVRHALDTQLLDIKDISKSQGVLVHVAGGEDVTLEEVTRAGEIVTTSLPPNTRIVWGAKVDPSMDHKARVMVVLTGVESTFLSNQPKWGFGPIKIGGKD
jgi:cell division protein FtsZ